jgi:hypothetical protein
MVAAPIVARLEAAEPACAPTAAAATEAARSPTIQMPRLIRPGCYVGRAQKSSVFAIASSVAEKGFTVVPTRLYFKGGRVKVELALGLGKELRDKRRAVAARDARREIEREL